MTVIRLDCRSKLLGGRVHMTALLPSDIQSRGGMDYLVRPPYRTLYLLHGLHGDDEEWLQNSPIFRLASDWGVAVIMPSCGNHFYVDSPNLMEKYGSFITDELVQFTRRTFPLSRKREDTFIGGLSMGGYGAIVAGLKAPHTFQGCIGFSPAMINGMIVENRHPYLNEQAAKTLFGLDKLSDFNGCPWDLNQLAKDHGRDETKARFFLCCGKDDIRFADNKAFSALLIGLGYQVAWREGEGGHEWNFWNSLLEPALKWAFAPKQQAE